MVSADVHSVSEHHHGAQVVAEAGVVLEVVEPPGHVDVMLLLVDGQVHLRGEREHGDKVQVNRICWGCILYCIGPHTHVVQLNAL